MHQNKQYPKAVCLIAIGMSGTGKTTFVGRYAADHPGTHTINLDPAVKSIPYTPFLDIRQTHQYKKIMKEFKLGPNGAILTALNLFTAQPEHIVQRMQTVLEQKPDQPATFLIDIPGQIEVFTWSSSSLILTQAISLLMPVKVVYILDAPRCRNPNVFLSNLLFAQSIQQRLQQHPFMVLLNKSDVYDPQRLLDWVHDYELFLESLQEDPSYLATLSRSIVIHLSDFFEAMRFAKISARTGLGLEDINSFLSGEQAKE